MNFTKLMEVSDSNLLRLTDIQKAVLLSVMVSQTPQLAYEACTGSEYIISARDFLYNNNLVKVYSNGIVITDFGLDALIANGLIDDDSEQTTDLGSELLDRFENEKKQLHEARIPFKKLKSFL